MNRTDQVKLTSGFSLDVWNITTPFGGSQLKICWNNYRILEATPDSVRVKSVGKSTHSGSFLPEYQVLGQQRVTRDWTLQAVEYDISTTNGTLIGKMGLLFVHNGVPITALNNDGTLIVPQSMQIMTRLNTPATSEFTADLGNDFTLSTTQPLTGDKIPLGLYYKDTALIIISTDIFSTVSTPVSAVSTPACMVPQGAQNTASLRWLAITLVILAALAVIAIVVALM